MYYYSWYIVSSIKIEFHEVILLCLVLNDVTFSLFSFLSENVENFKISNFVLTITKDSIKYGD